MTLLLQLTFVLVFQKCLQVLAENRGTALLPNEPHPWYIAKISRADAEAMLLERTDDGDYMQEDGAFIITESYSTPGDFILLVKISSEVKGFKVLRDGSGKYFLWLVKFGSLNELVEYHRTSSVSRSQTVYLRDMFQPKKYDHLVIAQYNFQGEDDDLSMKKGDIISVLLKVDANWWFGKCVHGANQGKKGLFPKTYVRSFKV